MIVRCLCCHRIERRQGGATIVVQAGGARRPEEPARAAREIVARSARGALGPIVGACVGCGQPLVADDPTAVRVPYAIPAEEGAPGARTRAIVGVFQGALLATMVVPILVWVFAVLVVAAFLSRADTLF